MGGRGSKNQRLPIVCPKRFLKRFPPPEPFDEHKRSLRHRRLPTTIGEEMGASSREVKDYAERRNGSGEDLSGGERGRVALRKEW